jgi:hypothetical protein
MSYALQERYRARRGKETAQERLLRQAEMKRQWASNRRGWARIHRELASNEDRKAEQWECEAAECELEAWK